MSETNPIYYCPTCGHCLYLDESSPDRAVFLCRPCVTGYTFGELNPPSKTLAEPNPPSETLAEQRGAKFLAAKKAEAHFMRVFGFFFWALISGLIIIVLTALAIAF
jgi:hypothetical protein